jgi:hypothetical protein
MPQPALVRIELRIGFRRRRGQVDLLVGEQVPVVLARDVGVVRVGEGDAERERSIALVAGVVVETAHGVERDLVVVLELVRDLRHARLLDGAHVVVPPVDPLVGPAPVGRPAEVARIDVRREPLLEPMELVGAHEVHLPAQACPVALEAQVVSEGRDGGGELRGVVVDARSRRQRAGHEHRPRGRAERARAVRALEHDSLLREPVDDRRLRDRVPVRAEEERGELVDDQEEDVRPVAHRRADASSGNGPVRGAPAR